MLSAGRNVVVRTNRILRFVKRFREDERWFSRAELWLGVDADFAWFRHPTILVAKQGENDERLRRAE